MIYVACLAVAQPSEATEYRVRRGDTLTRLAELTGHTVSELASMNGINDPNRIEVGRVITFISREDLRRAILTSADLAIQWSRDRCVTPSCSAIEPANPEYSQKLELTNWMLRAGLFDYTGDSGGVSFRDILKLARKRISATIEYP